MAQAEARKRRPWLLLLLLLLAGGGGAAWYLGGMPGLPVATDGESAAIEAVLENATPLQAVEVARILATGKDVWIHEEGIGEQESEDSDWLLHLEELDSFSDKSAKARGVTLKYRTSDGRELRVKGDRGSSTSTKFDTFSLEGNVRIETDDGLVVTAERLDYVDGTRSKDTEDPSRRIVSDDPVRLEGSRLVLAGHRPASGHRCRGDGDLRVGELELREARGLVE